jgi:tRNA A-37 threonylcarbamoyl transferase component Bud32
MTFVEVASTHVELFRRNEMVSARAFLAWCGALVGGHRTRHVMEVTLAGAPDAGRFYLKKEHTVPWRDRLASAWEGHGWVSKSVREARMLQQARQAGIPCPLVAAVGEDRPRAFLLLRAEEGLSELRTFLARPWRPDERRKLAQALGQALAALHRAGFDHPDLYAKHVLAASRDGDFRFCFLDWQRSRHHRRVGWRRRCRDLAALDASLAESLAAPRLRLACLRAYLAMQVEGPPLARVAAAIRRHSHRLLRRRKVRALRQAMPTSRPPHEQVTR